MRLRQSILPILTLLFMGCSSPKEYTQACTSNETCSEIIDSLINTNIVLQEKVDSLNDEVNYSYETNFSYHLIDLGINNPNEFIFNSFRQKLELIPEDAILGSSMDFGKIQLLGENWIIAEYSDGHIWGFAIFVNMSSMMLRNLNLVV